MSDSLSAFRAKNERQFAEANKRLDALAVSYIGHLAAALIDTTPGPNLQLPDTEYIATGRLRAAWSWSRTAKNEASRWDGGPLTEHGEDTLAAIEAALKAAGEIPALSFLQNDVAYGYIVHEGIGRMPVARPWVRNVAQDQHHYAAAAKAEVGWNG